MSDHIVKIETTITSVSAMSASARLSHSLAHDHFTSASIFAEMSRQLEDQEFSTRGSDGLCERQRHRAFVLGAVTCSALAIEGYINDFYLDAIERPNLVPTVDAKRLNELKVRWEKGEGSGKYMKTLDKYEKALTICTDCEFGCRDVAYKRAKSVFALRNFVVHYKSESDDALAKHQELRDRLDGQFPECQLYEPNGLWFPNQCLGAACAEWCVDSAEAFMEEFRRRTGYKRKLKRHDGAS